MLWFERQVVGTLMSPSLDAAARTAVEQYVDQTLRSMPEHLRMGVAAESLLFGATPWVLARVGRLDDDGIQRRLEKWKRSRLDVLRQYVRLLDGLVVFAEHEMATDAA